MRLSFREATADDVPRILELLTDDVLGRAREREDLHYYLTAFAQMQAEASNHLIVGQTPEGAVVATYQITYIQGLSLAATRRAQIESVRICSAHRRLGLGQQMFEDVEARARAAGCKLVQLTMNSIRKDAHRFYTNIGFEPTHTGFKRVLD